MTLYGHGVRIAPGEPHEVPGDVHDAHRLAHVEHEQPAALGDGGGVEDEPGGLGDGHEVARHLRVRDGQRLALLELVLEDGHDTAVRPEHVPEADGDVGASEAARGIRHDHLGDALAGAHDARGPDGLVRGDEHEALDADGLRRVQDGQRAADVRLDRLGGVVLEHGHVLVGSGMEDDVRAQLLEEPAHGLRRP